MRLVASELFHRFDRTRDVLRGVSLTVNADKTSTAVVAPSGSGKTTLLAIIGGLLPPTSGEVHVKSGTRLMWLAITFLGCSRQRVCSPVAPLGTTQPWARWLWGALDK